LFQDSPVQYLNRVTALSKRCTHSTFRTLGSQVRMTLGARISTDQRTDVNKVTGYGLDDWVF